MKPPGWLVMTIGKRSEDGRSVLMDVRVRLWHPGFWLAFFRHWWKEG